MFPRALLLMMTLLPALVVADDLVIPVGEQGADKASLERPVRWMTTAAVEEKFGAPLSKGNPVGTPPITSWEYPEYRVYFEGDRVLHTVLNPIPVESTPPPAAATPAETPAIEVPAQVPAEAPTAAPTPEAPAAVE